MQELALDIYSSNSQKIMTNKMKSTRRKLKHHPILVSVMGFTFWTSITNLTWSQWSG